MSIEESDKEAAAVAVVPRVSLDHIMSEIRTTHYFNVGEALTALGHPIHERHKVITICVVTVSNGFIFIGKSAPASPENYSALLGRKLAYEDAIRQIWPMEGYLLRSKLAGDP